MSPIAKHASPTNEAPPHKSKLPWAALALWAAITTTPLAYLMAGHMAVLPVASEKIAFAPEEPISGEAWEMLHVLSEQCQCSRDVIDYLIERRASEKALETVMLISSQGRYQSALRDAGFHVVDADASELCHNYGSEGVPFVQISTPQGALQYSGSYQNGGYATRSPYLDLSFLQAAQRGQFIPNKPVYGCATSDRLKQALDPFSIKYD